MKIVPLAQYTVVHDLDRKEAIMRLEGVVVLPIGAEIELESPQISVTVKRVRLLAGSDVVQRAVCLDVRRPAAPMPRDATSGRPNPPRPQGRRR